MTRECTTPGPTTSRLHRFRFVRRDGWEKWLPVEMPMPRVMRLADEYEVPLRPFADPVPAESSIRIRMFTAQEWVPEGVRRGEWVYSEDDLLLDEERFGANRPSLFRELHYRQRYMELLTAVRQALDDAAKMPGSALGEALVAFDTVQRIERIVGRHEREQRTSGEDFAQENHSSQE